MTIVRRFFSFLFLFALVVSARSAAADLTGLWQDDVGGRYRIRQVGTTIAWFDDRSPVAMNVFMGTIDGDSISGQWVDVPGGRMSNSGMLTLRIDSDDRLTKISSSTEYGGSVITRIGNRPADNAGAACTPIGTWDWLDGGTVILRRDGTSVGLSSDGSVTNDGHWKSLGGNRYRVSWRVGGWVDTLRLSADGRSMDGTNNVGRAIHVSCRSGNERRERGRSARLACTPAGTWDWLDGSTVVVSEDGSATGFHRDGSVSNDGRWEDLGNRRYRVTWRIGGWVDTLTLSADGQRWSGTNNVGRAVDVTCRNP